MEIEKKKIFCISSSSFCYQCSSFFSEDWYFHLVSFSFSLKTSFNFSHVTYLLVTISGFFFKKNLSITILISSSFLNGIFAGYKILDRHFFFFRYLNSAVQLSSTFNSFSWAVNQIIGRFNVISLLQFSGGSFTIRHPTTFFFVFILLVVH